MDRLSVAWAKDFIHLFVCLRIFLVACFFSFFPLVCFFSLVFLVLFLSCRPLTSSSSLLHFSPSSSFFCLFLSSSSAFSPFPFFNESQIYYKWHILKSHRLRMRTHTHTFTKERQVSSTSKTSRYVLHWMGKYLLNFPSGIPERKLLSLRICSQ